MKGQRDFTSYTECCPENDPKSYYQAFLYWQIFDEGKGKMCDIYCTSQHAHEMLVKGDARNFLFNFCPSFVPDGDLQLRSAKSLDLTQTTQSMLSPGQLSESLQVCIISKPAPLQCACVCSRKKLLFPSFLCKPLLPLYFIKKFPWITCINLGCGDIGNDGAWIKTKGAKDPLCTPDVLSACTLVGMEQQWRTKVFITSEVCKSWNLSNGEPESQVLCVYPTTVLIPPNLCLPFSEFVTAATQQCTHCVKTVNVSTMSHKI